MNLEGEGTIQYITDVELPHYKGERYKENKKTNPINLEESRKRYVERNSRQVTK